MKLISVIVPMYNSGSYIKRCLESIINQTYKDIEIILVDDSPNDNTDRICLECDMRIIYDWEEIKALRLQET